MLDVAFDILLDVLLDFVGRDELVVVESRRRLDIDPLAFERDVLEGFALVHHDGVRIVCRAGGIILRGRGDFRSELLLPVLRVDEYLFEVVRREVVLGGDDGIGHRGERHCAAVGGTLVGGYARRRNRIAQPFQRVESVAAAPATHGAARNAQHFRGHAETRVAFRTLGVHLADLLL